MAGGKGHDAGFKPSFPGRPSARLSRRNYLLPGLTSWECDV